MKTKGINNISAEEALAASELRYRRLFETAKDGILILDAETGIVVDVNPFLIDLLGYPYEHFVGKAIWDLGFFKDIVANQDHFAELQQKEYIRYEDKPLETADGRRIDVEFVSNVYLVDHKKVIQCNIRDITKRKRAEEALRASQRLIEGIINAISVRVFWKDRNLVYLGCNAAFARDAGFADPKDIIGKDDYQMGWSDQAELYRADDRKTLESGDTTSNREEPQTTPDGNTITLLASKMPLRDSDGKISGVLGTYVDITEQRQMEAQFRQVHKMEAVGRLAGGVAHDFNNMLGVILGYTGMALAQAGSAQPLCTNLQEIQKAAERSSSLTQQLLAFARKQTIAPKILNLNNAVEGLLNMLRRLIGEDINLVWQPGATLCQVKIDPSQIDQVLANLCLNARDAIANGGKITLETGKTNIDTNYCAEHIEAIPGEYVFVSVSDDGSGMDKETLAHIFEPFFTTKDVGKGTGLGLATVYGIVKQNNGFIYAYSEPGIGTTIRIYLPQIKEEAVDIPLTCAVKTPEAKGETVLLVEDEPSLNELFKLLLTDLGYSVLSVESPEGALKLFAKRPGDIHLLLTDVIMPRMNGQKLAKRISAIKPSIKVLFMSGYSADVITDRGVLDPNTAFIAKPFTRDELACKIRDILDPCETVNLERY